MLEKQITKYLNDVFSDRVWFVIAGHVALNNPPASTDNEDFKFITHNGMFSVYVYSIPK